MYRINEIFYSLQGEGHNTGRAAVFVRFAGCNMRCPFCDTDFSKYEELSVQEIIDRISFLLPPSSLLPIIVLTGGEPSLQVDDKLIDALHENGFYVAMETNGTHNVPETIDWLTVSPKGNTVIRKCNELKIVFDGRTEPVIGNITADHYYLQPCDTGDEEQNKEIAAKCVEYIKLHPQWKLSLQTHKLINIK